MKREIRIFKSFEEQEEFHLEEMRKTTIQERFQSLFRMQQINNLFHPIKDNKRRIIIHKNGHSQ